MKKKGLIISTVVMVVVLIASLTTATYAWFTSASSVQVDAINLLVKSSAKVNVGVRYAEGDGYDYYRYGDMTPNGSGNNVSWEDNGNVGLNSTLTFNGLMLGGDRAVGSSTSNSGWDGTTVSFDDPTLVLGTSLNPKYIVKAKGAGSDIDYGTALLADANTDYLDATIGVEANTDGVTGTYVKVTVTTTDSNPTLGINASVHFVIVLDGKYIDLEPFGAGNTNLALKSTLTDTSVQSEARGYLKYDSGTKQVSSTFYFWVAQGAVDGEGNYGKLGINGSAISDFRILAYIDGADDHCVKNATGGCKIEIEFDGTTDTKCEKLGDQAQTSVNTVKFITIGANVPA